MTFLLPSGIKGLRKSKEKTAWSGIFSRHFSNVNQKAMIASTTHSYFSRTLKKVWEILQGLGMKVLRVSLQRYHKDALKRQDNLFVSNLIIILKPVNRFANKSTGFCMMGILVLNKLNFSYNGNTGELDIKGLKQRIYRR